MRLLAQGDSRSWRQFFRSQIIKPFTYPQGRIPEDPEKRKRDHAVKYSDYALGQFFRGAKQQSFWTNHHFWWLWLITALGFMAHRAFRFIPTRSHW